MSNLSMWNLQSIRIAFANSAANKAPGQHAFFVRWFLFSLLFFENVGIKFTHLWVRVCEKNLEAIYSWMAILCMIFRRLIYSGRSNFGLTRIIIIIFSIIILIAKPTPGWWIIFCSRGSIVENIVLKKYRGWFLSQMFHKGKIITSWFLIG